ncbi:MAG TPA: hypothetical protein VJN94_15310 [Candidatus Binataceae bacterium]|nr:hypothetical protein [Candidatus Binataceae bacterium]
MLSRPIPCKRSHTASAPFVALIVALVVLTGLAEFFTAGSAAAQGPPFAGLTTYQYDNFRRGADLAETALTRKNVKKSSFGKIFADPVDGYIYAQPLYLPSVNIAGIGVRNVVFVATENDSVYAFDADAPGPPLWLTSFISPSAGVTPIPAAATLCGNIPTQVGITGTPVIDPSSQTLYVVAATQEGAGFVQRLHALDITTGQERAHSPVTITANVPGAGQGTQNGQIIFDPLRNLQRAALTLSNGTVYIAWGSSCDQGVYHGWLLAYDSADLTQTAAFNVTPNGSEGGMWMAAGGPAVDSNGDLVVATGNGTFDADLNPPANADFGDSVLRLGFRSGVFGVVDYFTPFDQANLAVKDLDLGSGGVALLPDEPGTAIHTVVVSGKNRAIYLLDRDDLGGFRADADNSLQTVKRALGGGFYATPSYWKGHIYMIASNDVPRSFAVLERPDTRLSRRWSAGKVKFEGEGAPATISANGTTNGILWAIFKAKSSNAVLYAFNASSLTSTLYSSAQNAARDSAGGFVRFSVPSVANGKVYIGTQTALVAYGLNPPHPAQHPR